MKAITPAQKFVLEYGQQHTVGATTNFQPCIYFTTEAFTLAATQANVDDRQLMGNYAVSNIFNYLWKGSLPAMQATGAGLSTIMDTSRKSVVLLGGKATYTLRNQSTEDENIEIYFCKPRHGVVYSDNATVLNVYRFISGGFAQAGIDPGAPTVANLGMTRAAFDITSSIMFTKHFNIQKRQKIRIRAGKEVKVHQGVKAMRIRADSAFVYDNSGQNLTWDTTNMQWHYPPWCKFIVVKLFGRPRGYGAAQSDYSKQISMTTPTILMYTHYAYTARILHNFKSPDVYVEGRGINLGLGLANTIINPDTATVGEEDDAV